MGFIKVSNVTQCQNLRHLRKAQKEGISSVSGLYMSDVVWRNGRLVCCVPWVPEQLSGLAGLSSPVLQFSSPFQLSASVLCVIPVRPLLEEPQCGLFGNQSKEIKNDGLSKAEVLTLASSLQPRCDYSLVLKSVQALFSFTFETSF